jgi:hypothetical protein
VGAPYSATTRTEVKKSKEKIKNKQKLWSKVNKTWNIIKNSRNVYIFK